LLTILLLISRIFPVRGREDAAPAQVGRAGGTTPGEKPSVGTTPGEKPSVGTTLAGAAGRWLAGERLRQAILAGPMSHGKPLLETELAEMIDVTPAVPAVAATRPPAGRAG
jgi:hypothetical protein